MRGKKTSAKQLATILELRRKGAGVGTIARKLKMGTGTIYQILRRAPSGLSARPATVTKVSHTTIPTPRVIIDLETLRIGALPDFSDPAVVRQFALYGANKYIETFRDALLTSR